MTDGYVQSSISTLKNQINWFGIKYSVLNRGVLIYVFLILKIMFLILLSTHERYLIWC